MVSINGSTGGFSLVNLISQSRTEQADLQRQLATGERYETYGDVGQNRHQLIGFTRELTQIEGFMRSIDHMVNVVDIMSTSVDAIRTMAAETRSDAFLQGFEPGPDGQTIYQQEAAARFHETVSLLNTDYAGRFLFGGANLSDKPVANSHEILNGKAGQAGFIQVMNERALADVGSDGLGRLTSTRGGPETLNLSEDGAHNFGMKLNQISHNLSGANVTLAPGAPASLDIDLAGANIQDGEAIKLSLNLPDGSISEITLTAKSDVADNQGDFLIGATAQDTLDHLQAALEDQLSVTAKTELKASSAIKAGDDFFKGDADGAPLRISGPPFETATGQIAGTKDDTIIWYKGENGSQNPRQTVQILSDDRRLIDYGARANEEALVSAMKAFAVLGTSEFAPDEPTSAKAYESLKLKLAAKLDGPSQGQTAEHILAELGTAQASAGRARENHKAKSDLLQTFVDDVKMADVYEVSTQLLQLQTRLQASYQVTGELRNLSLVNYI